MTGFLAIVDGLLLLGASLSAIYLAFAARRYFAERPRPFVSRATADDVGFVVSTHVTAGDVVTCVVHVGKSEFLVTGYRAPTPSAPS